MNKRALASRLRVSLPTLSAWLDKWADEFPVEQRGTNGREYLFDAEKVVDFLRAKQEEDARSKAGKDEQLQQLFLPLGLTPVESVNPGMSVREKLDAMKLAQMQATAERQAMENRARAGELVESSDITDLLTGCLLRWNKALHSALRQAAREHGLPEAVMRALERRLTDTQRLFVRDASAFLRGEEAVEPELERAHG